MHPADLPETAKAFSQALQTGTSYQAVHRLRRSDGEYRWHHTRAEPLHDQQGRIIQWYGQTIDIDEGKKAEEQLRRSEANLAEAQRLSKTGSWAINPAMTKILYWSEECYRIWGFDPAAGSPEPRNCVATDSSRRPRQDVRRDPRGIAAEKRLHGRFQNRAPRRDSQISRSNWPSSVLRGWRACPGSRYKRRCHRAQARRRSITGERGAVHVQQLTG